MRRLTIGLALAVLLSGAAVQTALSPGDSLTVSCPTTLTGSISTSSATLICAAATPLPTPSPTPSPTPIVTPTPTPISGTANPLTCTGYPEPRVFVEAQSWWLTTPGQAGTSFGHVHEGACFPVEGVHVSGMLHLDVRVILHNAANQTGPVKFHSVAGVIKTDSQELTVAEDSSHEGSICSVPTCTFWLSLNLNTALSAYDGRQEIRLRGDAGTSDGNQIKVSVNAHPYFANAKPLNPIDYKPYTRGKGWYSTAGYCEASLLTPVPLSVSGTWSPQIKMVNHGQAGPPADLPVTHHTARLDPDFHAVPVVEGTILNDGPGQLFPTTLAIDTRTLTNGRHVLHLRADCDAPSGSTNSGVLVIAFTVAN